MHSAPDIYGTRDFAVEIDPADVQVCVEEIVEQSRSFSDLVKDICLCIMEEFGVELCQDAGSRQELYLLLRGDIIRNLDI